MYIYTYIYIYILYDPKESSGQFPYGLALQEQHTAAKETPGAAEVVAKLPASVISPFQGDKVSLI